MPRLNFVVVTEDETAPDGLARVPVAAGPREQMLFEKTRKKGLGSALSGDTQKVEDIYFLAWLAYGSHCKREGMGQPALFEEWIEGVYDVEMADDADPQIG